MSSNYSVNIQLSPSTVKALKSEGASLYGFKAVQTTQKGGAPLVWFVDAEMLPTVTVNWSEQYEAYISTSQIITHGVIDASNNINVDLGETANVDVNGNLTVTETGVADAISINNQSPTQYTCGVSQLQGSVATPLCAFPLFGNNLDVIAPIEKVLFFFATAAVNTGTVVEQAFGPAVLLDLTGNPQLGLSYDINNGWDFGGESWGTSIPASSALVPFLIDTPVSAPPLARAA
jgi:hypothetical protein